MGPEPKRTVVDFARAHPAPHVTDTEEIEVAAAEALAKAAPDAVPLHAEPRQDANVRVLVKPLAKEQQAPTSAHALWASMAQGVDLTDANAVLACVIRLLVKLDEPQNPAAIPVRPQSDEADETQRLVDSVMGRRML